MVTLNATTHRTTITIVNYGDFNDSVTTKHTTNTTTSRQQARQQAATTKECKNEKNEKNITLTPKPERLIIPPTVDMVREYCQSRMNGIDAEEFVDFYTSKGWMVGKTKMKDWQATVRTWEKSHSNSRKRPMTSEDWANI